MRASVMREILKLPPPQRLHLAKNIIQSVADEQDYAPLTEKEIAILNSRIAEDERDPDGGLTLEEVERSVAPASRTVRTLCVLKCK